MTGRHHGVVRQILDHAPEAKWTHCFLHRESLAAKKMSPELHEVMDVSVKTINFIKNNAVNSRCFAKLCEGLEADNVQLLYHSEVRWLSRGLVLKCLFELRSYLFSLREILLLHIIMPMHSSQLNLPTSVTFFHCWTSWISHFKGEIATYFLLQIKFKLLRGNLLCGLRGLRKKGWTCFPFCLTFWKTPPRWRLVT